MYIVSDYYKSAPQKDKHCEQSIMFKNLFWNHCHNKRIKIETTKYFFVLTKNIFVVI